MNDISWCGLSWSPTDRANLEAIGEELRNVIRTRLDHSQRESDPLVESALRDTGGQS